MTKELEEKMEEKEYKKTSKYEWTEDNGEEFDPMIEKMSMEELEESMEELEKNLFADRKPIEDPVGAWNKKELNEALRESDDEFEENKKSSRKDGKSIFEILKESHSK